jgi:uncharacterized protein
VLRLLLLAVIRLYWRIVPEHRRRSCLFRVSCSNHVHAVTAESGFLAGLRALFHRWRRCRPGYRAVWDEDGSRWTARLADGSVADPATLVPDLLAPYEDARTRLLASVNQKTGRNEGIV